MSEVKEFKQFRIDCSQRFVIDDVDKCHIYGMVHPVFCVTERKRCPRMHDGPVVFPSDPGASIPLFDQVPSHGPIGVIR